MASFDETKGELALARRPTWRRSLFCRVVVPFRVARRRRSTLVDLPLLPLAEEEAAPGASKCSSFRTHLTH